MILARRQNRHRRIAPTCQPARIASRQRPGWALGPFILLWLIAGGLHGHPGHDHGPVPGADDQTADGPLRLTESHIRNLGIATVEADLMELAPTIDLAARVVLPEHARARLSADVAGTLVRVSVAPGDQIEPGALLAEVQPLAFGAQSRSVTAPFAGVVLSVHRTTGQGVGEGDMILELAQPDLAVIDAWLPLDIGAGPPPGQPARFEPFPSSAGHADGTVVGVDLVLDRHLPEATPDGHARLLRFTPVDPAGLPPVNSKGLVRLSLSEADLVNAIPADAVLGEMGWWFVFVRTDEGVFERREVELGMRAGTRVEVLDGVLPGEQVVVRGHYQLQFANSSAPPGESGDGHDHDDENEHAHDPPRHDHDHDHDHLHLSDIGLWWPFAAGGALLGFVIRWLLPFRHAPAEAG